MPHPDTPALAELLAVSAGPLQGLSWRVTPGLHWVGGGEQRGKTLLLRLLAGEVAPASGQRQPPASLWWEDPADPAHDAVPAQQWLADRQARQPGWQAGLAEALVAPLGLGEHLAKPLYMLSTGSRRKLGLLGAAASGAALTLLDQPWAALDARSGRVLDELLAEAAEGRERAWVVADYAWPAALAGVPLASHQDLGD